MQKWLGVHPLYVVVLLLAAAAGARTWWVTSQRAARNVAWTTCPFFGEPVVRMRTDLIAAWDTVVARVHEEVHAGQCRALGPVRYRLRSLTAAGKLSMETPAYCASAVARLTVDPDSQYASDRMHTDMIEGMANLVDSTAVKEALRKECPAIAAQPRRTRARIPRRAKA